MTATCGTCDGSGYVPYTVQGRSGVRSCGACNGSGER